MVVVTFADFFIKEVLSKARFHFQDYYKVHQVLAMLVVDNVSLFGDLLEKMVSAFLQEATVLGTNVLD